MIEFGRFVLDVAVLPRRSSGSQRSFVRKSAQSREILGFVGKRRVSRQFKLGVIREWLTSTLEQVGQLTFFALCDDAGTKEHVRLAAYLPLALTELTELLTKGG